MIGSYINDLLNNLLLTLKGNYSDDLTRMDGSEDHFEQVELLK